MVTQIFMPIASLIVAAAQVQGEIDKQAVAPPRSPP
jgi:hypothetical protein